MPSDGGRGAGINVQIDHHTRGFPPAIKEGTPIDTNFVDIQMDVKSVATRTEFGFFLQNLQTMLPQNLPSGQVMHTVSQWDIVCNHCGTAVTHYCTDDVWNGRYISHRREPYCRKAAELAVKAEVPNEGEW
ncbi:hypothetical protein HYPSUDRAFT_209048 [Hypholoma sublateritium FD-334 SS-4]|uniref:Uncharacterized protein n=1 Tax=Hypholoma sublateritium (strain FD-334 SS-4) TaxID=945553 RepID=A0A0D2N487_HYPSF|nr:hypothetical protein HYPSUDRAFT_209048 [Hypholoma sublateritium FD-334 SS-4]